MEAGGAGAGGGTGSDSCPCLVEDLLPCDTAAGAMRRKRIEIRRIRLLANSGDGLLKRSRIHQLREPPSSNKKSREGDEQQQLLLHGLPADEECDLAGEPPMLASSSSGSDEFHVSCTSAGRDGCPAYGTVSVCGRRREMEDAVAVQADFSTLPCTLAGCMVCTGASGSSSSLHFFGVYDGHGGSQAATYCQERLHTVLDWEMRQMCGQQQRCPAEPAKFWEDAMTRCFLKVDEQVRRPVCGGEDCGNCNGDGCEVHIPETVGSTAVVAVVSSSHIIIANCGDCRAVISRDGKAVQLSADHKASRADEMARVEAAGGQVINWDIPRILGILAMSRSIGDQYMTPYLIANPEVTFISRTESDECLILASDGLWDKVSNDAACDIARKCIAGRRKRNGTLRAASTAGAAGTAAATTSPDHHHQEDDSPCSAAASVLLKVALHNGSKDNISVVVIDLKRLKEKEVPSSG